MYHIYKRVSKYTFLGHPVFLSYLRVQERTEGQSEAAYREAPLLRQHHHQAARGHVPRNVQG